MSVKSGTSEERLKSPGSNADDVPVKTLETEIAARLRRLGKTAEIRSVRREFTRRLQGGSARTVLSLAKALICRNGNGSRLFDYELVHKAVRGFLRVHRRVLAARVTREVENKLATGVKNPKR